MKLEDLHKKFENQWPRAQVIRSNAVMSATMTGLKSGTIEHRAQGIGSKPACRQAGSEKQERTASWRQLQSSEIVAGACRFVTDAGINDISVVSMVSPSEKLT
jgi:hypothetical protein